MEDAALFQTIQYRNGIYEGMTKETKPQGAGLFFDDDSALYCSIWNKGLPSGRTAIFIAHGKYFYGEWQMGKPHGFNVFRSGDTVLVGNYDSGKLTGRFMVIFERQSFVAIVGGADEPGAHIQRKYYSTDQELKNVTSKLLQSIFRPDDYFSLVLFLKYSFCKGQSPLRMQYQQGTTRFGYDRGLGAVFDDDNYIRRVGYLDEDGMVAGLGAMYGITNQQGNFETGNIIRYNLGTKPVQEIRRVYKGEHKRSIYFRNDFISLKTQELVDEYENLLKVVIERMLQNKISDGPGGQAARQFNDSLQFHPRKKIIDSGQRIKRIKDQIQQSMSRTGPAVRPSPTNQDDNKDALKRLNPNQVNSSQYSHNTDRGEQSDDLEMFRPKPSNQSQIHRNGQTNYQQKRQKHEESRQFTSERIRRKQTNEEQQWEAQRQKQRQRERQKRIQEAIQKQMKEIPKLIKTYDEKHQGEELRNQNKLSSKSKASLLRNYSDLVSVPIQTQLSDIYGPANASNQRSAAEKSTTIKTPPKEIHYNPFLRTFVSSKYPPFPTADMPFQTIQTNPQVIRSQHKDTERDPQDSLQKIKRRKGSPSKLLRYQLRQPEGFSGERHEGRNNNRNIKYTTLTKKADPASRYAVPQNRTVQRQIKQERIVQRSPGKSYLEIYKTKTETVERSNSYRSKSPSRSPLCKGLTTNSTRKSIHTTSGSPITKPREHVGKKIIEIQHERTSPEGKKTTTYERIIKKYHYMSQNI